MQVSNVAKKLRFEVFLEKYIFPRSEKINISFLGNLYLFFRFPHFQQQKHIAAKVWRGAVPNICFGGGEGSSFIFHCIQERNMIIFTILFSPLPFCTACWEKWVMGDTKSVDISNPHNSRGNLPFWNGRWTASTFTFGYVPTLAFSQEVFDDRISVVVLRKELSIIILQTISTGYWKSMLCCV